MTAPPGLTPDRRVELARRAMEAHDYGGAATLARPVVDALGATHDPGEQRLLVRALTILACSRHEVDVDRSWSPLLDRAAEIVEAASLVDLRVAVAGARAYCHLRGGDVHAAMAVFDTADPWLDDASTEDRVRFLLNRGFVRLEVGDLDAAGRDLGRVEQEGAAADLLELAQKARHNRGFLAFIQGDLPRALDVFARGVADVDLVPAVGRLMDDPIARMDRARVLQEAGLVDEGDAFLEQAIGDMAGSGRHQDVGEAHLLRARGALASGDLDLAAEQTERAARLFVGRRNARWARRATFVRLAVRLEQAQSQVAGLPPTDPTGIRPDPSLADQVEDLARAADDADDVEISLPAWFMLAEAALVAGDPDRAGRALDGRAAEDAAVSVRLRWYRARAGLAAARADADLQQIVEDGLVELGRAQARLGSVDLRTAMAIHGRELAEIGVADAVGRDDPEVVHGAVERSHASSTRIAPVRPSATAREREQLARLRRANDALWRRDESGDPERDRRLRREITRLQHDLRHREWQRSGVRSDVGLADLATVRAHLEPSGAVAVSYTSVGSRLLAVRIDQRDVTVVELGDLAAAVRDVEQVRSDLQAVVLSGVPEAVRSVMRRSVDATLQRLDARLLRPLEVGPSPLVLVPHGALALVPWSLVPSRLGLASTMVPSLTMWARLRGRAGSASGAGVVAVAGPGLDRSAAEAVAVAGAWAAGRVAQGADATGAVVRRALREADVVHLATHGHHQAASPLFSSLRLHDGPIFAHELEPDPRARLVVLSSCEVGSHTVRRGDEPLGLTAALLQAGVPTVLAGLARVRDETAHDVMIGVHEGLVAGLGPAEALAMAVADAADAGHLAPFGCLGAGLVPVV